MCGYALKIVGVRTVYFILANPKFGGAGSLMKISGLETERIEYRSADVVQLLKRFYTSGNSRLKPENRHRKPKDITQEDQKKTTDSMGQTVNLLGKRSRPQLN
jgi:tRNA(Arg) A34 adenosine deaminase TadA